jgi:hypothetical protein
VEVVMKCLRYLACGAAMVASAGPPVASAAIWDPQNVERTATTEFFTYLTMGELTWTCSHVSMTVKSLGSVAATTAGVSNPMSFTSCDSSIGTMTVTTLGTWELTATSTTSVDLTATGTGAGGTGPVMIMSLDPLPNCTLVVDGPQTIAGNAWSTATHRLVLNNTVGFTQTLVGSGCSLRPFTTLLKLDSAFTLPSDVIIT